MHFVTRHPTTAPLSMAKLRLHRWQRIILASVLGLLCAGFIITGLALYTSGTSNWGLQFSSLGPQSACYNVACTRYEWDISNVALGSLAYNNGLKADSVVCGYITDQGQSIL